jgi:hypothetical protein
MVWRGQTRPYPLLLADHMNEAGYYFISLSVITSLSAVYSGFGYKATK